ncbi:conserved domain protein, partial [Actinomyces sp. oral taxon 170 str. F0386]
PHSAIGMRTPTEHETAWLPDTDNVVQQTISQPQPATTGARQTSLHVDTDRVPSTISWALGSRSFTIGTWSLRAWAIRGV